MKVLVLSPDFPPEPGGIQLVAHRIAGGMERLQPRVVTLDSAGAAEFDAGRPVEVRRVAAGGGLRRASIVRLNAVAVAEARRFRPDVVLSIHIVMGPAARTIRRLLGVPVVQYLHGREVAARPRLAGLAVRGADATIAVSRYTEELALGVGAEPGRLRRIPPGVDLRERRVPRSSQPLVLTISRLAGRYKGHDVLARALPAVRARVPGVEWVVVGDGPLRGWLSELVAEQGLDGAVRLVGAVPDRERDEWLDRAHVFAMPSRVPADEAGGEGFGIVYLEAGVHGLPVVAGDVGGALDAVVDGETGVLVDPTDHAAVADAIAGLLLDEVRAEALGRAGAARAREFAWPSIVRRVEDLLLEVAGRERGSPCE